MAGIDRRAAVVAVAGGAVILAAVQVLLDRFYADPSFLKPHDFLQYWAAGRLNATGGNPYDAGQLFELQRAAGRPDPHPVLMWNPPWALTLTSPFGLLPARTSQLVWVVAQLGLVLFAAGWVWRVYGGDPDRQWVAWLLAGVAPMTGGVLAAGQGSGWVLVGLVGFLAAAVRGRPHLAALAVLGALKPHLLVPFWILLVLDATRSRAGAARLAWGLAAGGVAVLVPVVTNPAVWSQYLTALARPAGDGHVPLSAWQPPVVGWWLRMAVAPDKFWVQFVPTAVVAGLTPVYWWYRRATWDWREEFPRVVLAGALAAPYGAWDYDLVILLVPVVAAAARLSRAGKPAAVAVAVAGAAAFVVAAHATLACQYAVWMTPAVTLGYAWAHRATAHPAPVPVLSPIPVRA